MNVRVSVCLVHRKLFSQGVSRKLDDESQKGKQKLTGSQRPHLNGDVHVQSWEPHLLLTKK